jgi:hypothetical protein
VAQRAQDDWEALRSVGELFPGTALGDSADQLRGWPEELQHTPIILATGSGKTEQSVAAIARRSARLALVLTSGSATDADALRAELTSLGRGEVRVADRDDALAAVEDLLETVAGPVRWIGLGQPDQLTALLDTDFVSRLRVTQLQVGSGAGPLLEAAAAGRLALDIVSPNPADGEIGPLVAVAAGLLVPFVDFRQVPVGEDEVGRFQLEQGGVVLWWGFTDRAGALQSWLDRTAGEN